MERNFEKAVQHVLAWEGGYVNHPDDPGGETKFGIADLSDGVADGMADLDDDGTPDVPIRNLTVQQAQVRYRNRYWLVCRCDFLPDGLDLAVFDFAVNSGTSRAIMYLQRLVGAVADGHAGPATLRAVEAFVKANNAYALLDAYCAERERFIRGVKDRRTGKLLFPVFGKGWLNRLNSTRSAAAKCASTAALA